MATWQELLKQAESLGRETGNNAASWYFDRTETNLDNYRRVLNGIRDGDPMILDTFPSAPLSGEYAGDMTPKTLFELLRATDRQVLEHGVGFCEAYEEGFFSAFQESVEQECLNSLERSVVFHIGVTIREQNEQELLSKLTDLLARENCDLDFDEVEEV